MRTAGPGIAAVRCALGCYPAWWRQRYGAEQEELAGELAAEGRSCWLMAAGLAAGSVRARVTGSGMPPVAELWSRRACSSVVAGAVAAAVALPLELAFLGTVDSRSAGLSTWAALTQNGAGRVVRWELNALLLVWLIGAAQLLSAGSVLVRGLWALPSRRLTAAALAAAPLAAVVLGIVMIRAAGSLQPIVSGGEKNLVTGVTHLYYLRPGQGAGDGAVAGRPGPGPGRARDDDGPPGADRPRWPHVRICARAAGSSCPGHAGSQRRAVGPRCGLCASGIRPVGAAQVSASRPDLTGVSRRVSRRRVLAADRRLERTLGILVRPVHVIVATVG